jgi:outer membrane protein assembly factor BamB
MRKASRALVAVVPALVLTACSLFDADTDKQKLTGERISVLTLDKRLEADPALSQLEIRLPRPVVNNEWPEPGGYPNHVMQHVALGDDLETAWEASIGDGSTRHVRLVASPVAAGDRLFTMDAEALVRAFDRKTGERLWEMDAKPEDAGASVGGGVAFGEGRLFVATGYAEVIALDPADGTVIWRQKVVSPLHAAPTVADGRVFVVTVDNELDVLAAADGRKLWSHSGTAEAAGLVGGASPAVEGDVAVVAYSSGEIFALRVENGRELWSDSLAAVRNADAMTSLADIRGRPVIDRGRVFAISHSGRMEAIDLRTGTRAWEQDIGGSETPWVAGDFIYVLTNDSTLVCLTRTDGRVRWIAELPRYQNPEKKKDPLVWTGPVLGGDRLIVIGSDGEAMTYSPYTGELLGRIELSEGAFVPPIIADQTLYVLTDDAELIAMK